MRKEINNWQEALDYINADLIECLECGKKLSFLPPHLKRAHQMQAPEYREKYNLPATLPLAGLSYRNAHREKMNRLIADGTITHWHLKEAVEQARGAERSERRDYDKAQQAARMLKNAHHSERTLPPGSKRANGRDADNAREYQRQYRAKKKLGKPRD
ncbi:MucR family transcriptional regulator [Cronobacter turicensis]